MTFAISYSLASSSLVTHHPFLNFLVKLLTDWHIRRSRPVPRAVKNASKLKHTMLDAMAEKEDRRRKHSRRGETKPKADKKKIVMTVAE